MKALAPILFSFRIAVLGLATWLVPTPGRAQVKTLTYVKAVTALNVSASPASSAVATTSSSLIGNNLFDVIGPPKLIGTYYSDKFRVHYGVPSRMAADYFGVKWHTARSVAEGLNVDNLPAQLQNDYNVVMADFQRPSQFRRSVDVKLNFRFNQPTLYLVKKFEFPDFRNYGPILGSKMMYVK